MLNPQIFKNLFLNSYLDQNFSFTKLKNFFFSITLCSKFINISNRKFSNFHLLAIFFFLQNWTLHREIASNESGPSYSKRLIRFRGEQLLREEELRISYKIIDIPDRSGCSSLVCYLGHCEILRIDITRKIFSRGRSLCSLWRQIMNFDWFLIGEKV